MSAEPDFRAPVLRCKLDQRYIDHKRKWMSWMREVCIGMHWLSLRLRAWGWWECCVATAEGSFWLWSKHAGCDLIRDRVEKNWFVEERPDGWWILLDVPDVVIEGHVLATGL